MPLVWRYLLFHYFQFFFVSIGSFITALLVMRLKEIAQFGSLDAGYGALLLFICYQLPYILPIAIPLSAVIASALLLQKMSQRRELLILRAAGMTFFQIFFPLLLGGIILSLLNFTVLAELGPRSRVLAKQLYSEVSARNPFYLFHHLSKRKASHAYVEMNLSQKGRGGEELVLVLSHPRERRLELVTAQEVHMEKELLQGKGVSLISTSDSQDPRKFDHLIIENQDFMCMNGGIFFDFFKKGKWRVRPEYFSFKYLVSSCNFLEGEHFWKHPYILEMARRISLSCAPFFLTLLGVTMGGTHQNQKKSKEVLWITLLILFYLIAFFGAKSMKRFHAITWILYFFPLFLIFISSLYRIRKRFET